MKNTFTSLYQNGDSTVICSLRLTHRTGNSQIVEIDSPLPAVKTSFVKINTLSTSHNFLIHNVKNGTLADFINSIALCIIQARLPFPVSVSASISESFLVYSPSNDCVDYFYSENLSDKLILAKLKAACIEKYENLQKAI